MRNSKLVSTVSVCLSVMFAASLSFADNVPTAEQIAANVRANEARLGELEWARLTRTPAPCTAVHITQVDVSNIGIADHQAEDDYLATVRVRGTCNNSNVAFDRTYRTDVFFEANAWRVFSINPPAPRAAR